MLTIKCKLNGVKIETHTLQSWQITNSLYLLAVFHYLHGRPLPSIEQGGSKVKFWSTSIADKLLGGCTKAMKIIMQFLNVPFALLAIALLLVSTLILSLKQIIMTQRIAYDIRLQNQLVYLYTQIIKVQYKTFWLAELSEVLGRAGRISLGCTVNIDVFLANLVRPSSLPQSL